MKQIYKTAITALAVFVMITACGNAGAQNEKKNSAEAPQQGVTELNAKTFDTKVYDMDSEGQKYLGDKPAIVDFTASWCGPCQRLAPVLEELATEYKGKIEVYKVDVDKCRDLAQAFEISSIPALLFIPTKGKPSMMVGLRSKKQLKEEIESVLLGK